MIHHTQRPVWKRKENLSNGPGLVDVAVGSVNNFRLLLPVSHLRRSNNKVYFRLSHDVVTSDIDCDVSTAYC